MVKNSLIPGRSAPITAAMTSGDGLVIQNLGKKTVIVQLVRTDSAVVPPDMEPRTAADIDLYGHWELLPEQYLGMDLLDYPISEVEFGGASDYTLLLFSETPASVAYAFKGATA